MSELKSSLKEQRRCSYRSDMGAHASPKCLKRWFDISNCPAAMRVSEWVSEGKRESERECVCERERERERDSAKNMLVGMWCSLQTAVINVSARNIDSLQQRASLAQPEMRQS